MGPLMDGSDLKWWPNQLNVKILAQESHLEDPMCEEFNYAEEVKTLDLDAVKAGIEEVMTLDRFDLE